MIHYLDSASDRVHGKKRHRAGNVLLLILGAILAFALLRTIRLWLNPEESPKDLGGACFRPVA
jgi:hypothetical protein